MGYDLRIARKANKETVSVNTHDAELYVTFNYYPIFKDLFGEDSLIILNGKDIAEAQILLDDAYNSLPLEKPDDDWYKCTVGNVRSFIKMMIDLADSAMKEYPETEMIWEVTK